MHKSYLIDAVRTPRARRKGKFSSVHPVDLLTYPLKSLIERNQIAPDEINDVITGCVTQAGEQSWCVARTAILASGWPHTIPGVTINRLCSSGLQACNFASQGIQSNNYNLVIGSGLEHMTRCPMFSDVSGEESKFLKKQHPDLVHQGLSAELIAKKYNFSRLELDQYSYDSQMKAKNAQANNYFKSIIPVEYKNEGEPFTLTQDDTIREDTTIEALSSLKPVFKEDGVITAGNASSIVDGASAALFSNEDTIKRLNLKPKAEIISTAVIGSDPLLMLTGPIEASKEALKKANLKINDIDLWEINEAFAPIVLMTQKELDLDPKVINVNGGGISLGHPLGATGTMLLGTAVDELERREKDYALITMCIGLGMGIATIIKRIN
ncbi:UNVERIFIED_CONTAM: hypothetical protein GTU68_028113 [Idotea baltica]|nr:hypothetical protein [Idotea baltica]